MDEISRRNFCSTLSCSILGLSGCLDEENKTEVISVIDGDTIDVILPDGSEDRVRLLGVDTPEMSDNEPSEWYGIPSNQSGERWLSKWAKNAKSFAESNLLNNTVKLEYDSISDRRGSYDRLLAYVFTGKTTSFNLNLIKKGYARMYDSEFEKRERFHSLEKQSISATKGVWSYKSTESSGITVLDINADAKGNDIDNLNNEYLVLKNNNNKSIDMSRWKIFDEIKQRYVFPRNYSIDTKETVKIRTGSGENDKNNLYINSSRPIWNNDGDKITIENKNGSQILEYKY